MILSELLFKFVKAHWPALILSVCVAGVFFHIQSLKADAQQARQELSAVQSKLDEVAAKGEQLKQDIAGAQTKAKIVRKKADTKAAQVAEKPTYLDDDQDADIQLWKQEWESN